MKKPEFVVEIEPVVSELKNSVDARGKFRAVELKEFSREIDCKIEAYREIYGAYLRDEWGCLFPGVPYSENLLRDKLDEVLRREKEKAIRSFKKRLNREDHYRVFMNFVLRKWTIRFFVVMAASFFSFPLFLYLFFMPYDLAFQVGGIGLLLNACLLGYTFFKST